MAHTRQGYAEDVGLGPIPLAALQAKLGVWAV